MYPSRISSAATTLVLALAAMAPTIAAAQTPAPEYSRFTGEFNLMNTQAMGELATGPGFGIALSGAWSLDQARIFRLRGDIRFSMYDHETRRVCVTSCLIEADLDTNHGFMYIGVGPEIALPLGAAELALDATAGFIGFSSSSSLSGVDAENENLLTTNNHEDGAFAWSTGGALRIPLGSQVSLALGAHYMASTGPVTYLLKGRITELSDGSLRLDTTTTEAEAMAFTIGVAIRPFVSSGSSIDDLDGFDG